MKKNPVDILQEIYRLYETRLETTDIACTKYCADCCTTSVTITRLEGLLISQNVAKNRIANALFRGAHDERTRYRPAMSTNAYVEMCRTDASPNDDPPGEQTGTCPFLESRACTIYPVRPFACRCMVSTRNCAQKGYAVMDDYTLSLNTVFLQFIEHLDQNGFSGNLIDVLACLEPEADSTPDTSHLIPNRPIPVLMVPPEHRGRIAGVIDSLGRLMADDQPSES